jgi:hypothetical protein
MQTNQSRPGYFINCKGECIMYEDELGSATYLHSLKTYVKGRVAYVAAETGTKMLHEVKFPIRSYDQLINLAMESSALMADMPIVNHSINHHIKKPAQYPVVNVSITLDGVYDPYVQFEAAVSAARTKFLDEMAQYQIEMAQYRADVAASITYGEWLDKFMAHANKSVFMIDNLNDYFEIVDITCPERFKYTMAGNTYYNSEEYHAFNSTTLNQRHKFYKINDTTYVLRVSVHRYEEYVDIYLMRY